MSKKASTGKFRRFLTWSLLVGLTLCAFALSGAFVILLVLNKDLPSIDSLKNYRPKEVSRVYSRHGELIGEFFTNKRIVADEVPEVIRNAFVAAEDAKFHSHQGVDFLGMLRAAYVNFKAGTIRQGASTITQQVAREFLLTRDRTYTRKLREIILAWRIENNLTKDQILHLYLNHIYLGHGAYGVAAAAEVYFGKTLDEVTLAEAAILGGLPQAPSRYSPARNPDRVKRRQMYVLRQMRGADFISQSEYEEAANADIWVEPRVNLNRTVAPYFVEHVRQYVMDKYGSRRVLEGGLEIHTTLDPNRNRHAQNALRQGLNDLERRQGYRGPLENIAMDEVDDYFEGRVFSERDGEEVVRDGDLEVSQEETEGRGTIRMRTRQNLEVGDFIEGVVVRVEDADEYVLVEYEPGVFAYIPFEEMDWAHERIDPSQRNQQVSRVRKPSDVLEQGDVIVMSVKSLDAPDLFQDEEDNEEDIEAESVIQASLEQHTEVEGAVLSIDPRNGQVYSMVGGYDFNRSEFNRALQARRQPGSAFKPVVYAAAIDLGFTPASQLQDTPITFQSPLDEERWRPLNYDRRFIGETTLRHSLLVSRNITTIRLLNEIGIDTAISYARRLGIESPLSRDFTLGLGSSVLTLDETMRPYSVFVNGGYEQRPIFVSAIYDRDGEPIEERVPDRFHQSQLEVTKEWIDDLKTEVAAVELSRKEAEVEMEEEPVTFLREAQNSSDDDREVITSELKAGQVLSSEASYIMTHLLRGTVLYGSGRRARELDRPAAGKTGTTDANRDAWFIGYTPQMLTGVWVGYDDLRALGRFETGSRAAIPIWLEYMLKATASQPVKEFEVPENIEFARIDPKTGELAPAGADGAVFEAFVEGTAPTARSGASQSRDRLDLYQ